MKAPWKGVVCVREEDTPTGGGGGDPDEERRDVQREAVLRSVGREAPPWACCEPLTPDEGGDEVGRE